MERYTLSYEGRARFKKRKISVGLGMDKMEGYEILDYLYEHGAATVAEIESYTGLSHEQLMDKISTFVHHGYIEGIS